MRLYRTSCLPPCRCTENRNRENWFLSATAHSPTAAAGPLHALASPAVKLDAAPRQSVGTTVIFLNYACIKGTHRHGEFRVPQNASPAVAAMGSGCFDMKTAENL